MYKNFDDLCRAVAQGLHRIPEPVTREKIEADPELMEICRLVKIYCDAERNPPEGIIGVGCITYAEQMLQDAQ